MTARPDRAGLALLPPLLAGLCAPTRLAESRRILQEVAAGGAGVGARAVNCAACEYAPAGVLRNGDLYWSGMPAAGLVLLPGASRQGKDDPRLVAFAEALARARFEVLVPDLPGLSDFRISADDAALVADALAAFSQHRASRGNATTGLVAICYSTGPAMLALLEERARGTVQFMLSIGGYYDIEAVITFFTTGCYRSPADSVQRHRPPDEYGKWISVISNVAAVEDPKDRELLESMARRRLDDRGADLSDLVPGLGDEGRALYALINNTDPQSVPALIAALPDGVRREIARMDLKRRDFSQLDMRFILTHANDDAVIPETESMALAGAVPAAELYILHSMQHVDPGPAGLGDKLKMLAAMQALLRERDRVRVPAVPVDKSPLTLPASPCGGA